jgi:HD superfamily phosphohydrolase
VGHCAFSHTTDDLLKKMGYTHEKISCQLIKNPPVADVLVKYGIKPSFVANLVSGRTELGKIISSEIDLDRMDYLVRDAYYAGVAYGVIDVERIISGMRTKGRRLFVEEGSLEAVELLLISRNMMYETVYRHHTKRIAELMLKHALDFLHDAGALPFEKFSVMDDFDVISLMRDFGGYPTDMISRIDERRIFKTVASVKASSLPKPLLRKICRNPEEIERQICEDYDAAEGYVLLDIPETKSEEFKVKIEVDGELKSIRDVSYLARSLEKSEKEKLTVRLHAPADYMKKFKNLNLREYLA